MVGSDEWWIKLFRGVTFVLQPRVDLTAPRSLVGHRSALRRISGDCWVRSGVARLGRPAERRAIDPHAMQDDGKPASDGDDRLGHAPSLGNAQAPCLQCGRPGLRSQDNKSGLEQGRSKGPIAILGDLAAPVDLAGLMRSRRQAEMGADGSRALETGRLINGGAPRAPACPPFLYQHQ